MEKDRAFLFEIGKPAWSNTCNNSVYYIPIFDENDTEFE